MENDLELEEVIWNLVSLVILDVKQSTMRTLKFELEQMKGERIKCCKNSYDVEKYHLIDLENLIFLFGTCECGPKVSRDKKFVAILLKKTRVLYLIILNS